VQRFLAFVGWPSLRRVEIARSATVDRRLTEFLEDEYRRDGSFATGAHAVFGLMHAVPRLRRKLHRAQRALKGWEKSRPKRSHPLLTWELTVLVSLTLAASGFADEALATVLAFDCYMRLKEFVNLRGSDIARVNDARLGGAHPAMAVALRTTKTGPNRFVSIANPQVEQALTDYLQERRIGVDEQPVFRFTAARYRSLFHRACAAVLGRSDSRFVPHSLRHGGATHDFLRGSSIEQIKFRGRWESTKSTSRYIQQGPAILLRASLPDSLLETAAVLSPSLADCLSYLRAVTPPAQRRSDPRMRVAAGAVRRC
jgi:integrase